MIIKANPFFVKNLSVRRSSRNARNSCKSDTVIYENNEADIIVADTCIFAHSKLYEYARTGTMMTQDRRAIKNSRTVDKHRSMRFYYRNCVFDRKLSLIWSYMAAI